MPFNRNHVRGFLAKAEIDLFESSLGADLKARSAVDLQRRIDRTRKLRDKNKDLLRRQKLNTRTRTGSKMGRSGEEANERTAKKVKAFEEALSRFEAQSKQIERTSKLAAVKAKRADRPGPIANSKKASKTAAKPAPKSFAKTSQSAKSSDTTAKPAARKQAPKKRAIPAAVMLHDLLDKKRDALAQATSAPSTRSRKASALQPGNGPDGVGLTPPDVRAAVVSSRLDQAGMARIQGHTGTQVRHAQAKRDQRG